MHDTNSPNPEEKHPIIIVSNRLPITVKATDGGFHIQRSAGGLVAGLRGIHERSLTWWVGHGGVFDAEGYAKLKAKLEPDRLLPVPIERETYEG